MFCFVPFRFRFSSVSYFIGTPKPGFVWKRVNTLQDDKNLYLSDSKTFADDKIKVGQLFEFFLEKIKKNRMKRRKYWLSTFSPFPTMFSKSLFFRIVKTRAFVV